MDNLRKLSDYRETLVPPKTNLKGDAIRKLEVILTVLTIVLIMAALAVLALIGV